MKIKKLDSNTFESNQATERFGAIVTKHEALADGAMAQELQVESKTHLEDDLGGGGSAIIRVFEFGINPVTFSQYQPTKQDLFNSHHKGIEIALWRDGLKVVPDVNPRIVVDIEHGVYRIFVGAQPMRGHSLIEQPRTLGQQIHGK